MRLWKSRQTRIRTEEKRMNYVLSEMTWPEVQEALSTVKLALIPTGAHEQHGPHMCESCDTVLAEAYVRRLTQRLSPWALAAPTIGLGLSVHHMHFPGTITLRPETFSAVIRDTVWSLKQHGLENFLIINAHGGNRAMLEVLCTQLSHELDVHMYYAKTTESAKKVIREFVHSPVYGHSCEYEVSQALYVAPEIVRTDRLEKGKLQEGPWRDLRRSDTLHGFYYYDEVTQNGCIGDARQASREAGEAIVEESLRNLEQAVRKLFNLPVE